MITGMIRRLFLLAICGVLLVTAVSKEVLAESVTGLRLGIRNNLTLVVIEGDAPIPFKYFTLGDPYRVVLDLPEMNWKVPRNTSRSKGLVGNLRYGLYEPGTFRVVLDLKRAAKVKRAYELKPYGKYKHRIVLELKQPAGLHSSPQLRNRRGFAKNQNRWLHHCRLNDCGPVAERSWLLTPAMAGSTRAILLVVAKSGKKM